MKLLDILSGPFPAPRLTRRRMALGLIIAVAADGLQWLLALLGPVGFFLDEIIDVIAMALTTWAIGFHLLLLPTFVVELLPVVDMLPTWTACVTTVIALRKAEQRATGQPAPPEVQTVPRDDNSG